jgi:transposase
MIHEVLAMMGHQTAYQHKFFVTGFSLEKRVRKDHLLRRIQENIDFEFIYKEVEGTYGVKGNVSVPPPVILKLMLLLFLYDVRSERELMVTIPERLDWLWFLGYGLEDEIPDHSVLSKARARWGGDAFRKFFERVLWACVQAGLVGGSKLFVDSSLIEANASNNSVVDTQKLGRYLNESYIRLESRLDEILSSKKTPADSRYISTTDPDASVTRHSGGKSKLRYKTHRAVDPKHEIITATKVSPGSVDDGHLLEEMVLTHEVNTQGKAEVVVADSKYGTRENLLLCHDLGIKAHIPSLKETHKGSGRQKGIFPEEAFSYDPGTDSFTCPEGQLLRKRNFNKTRNHYEYKASRDSCARCPLRERCTRSKDGRTLKRHIRQDDLDAMLQEAKSRRSKEDINERKHISERSFAEATRYGLKRARWRGLWRMQIQDFLIAAVQNILVLLREPKHKMSKSHIEDLGAVGHCPRENAPHGPIEAVLNWLFPWGSAMLDPVYSCRVHQPGSLPAAISTR